MRDNKKMMGYVVMATVFAFLNATVLTACGGRYHTSRIETEEVDTDTDSDTEGDTDGDDQAEADTDQQTEEPTGEVQPTAGGHGVVIINRVRVGEEIPWYRTWWFWTVVGLGLAGAGLGFGLGFGLDGQDINNGSAIVPDFKSGKLTGGFGPLTLELEEPDLHLPEAGPSLGTYQLSLSF